MTTIMQFPTEIKQVILASNPTAYQSQMQSKPRLSINRLINQGTRLINVSDSTIMEELITFKRPANRFILQAIGSTLRYRPFSAMFVPVAIVLEPDRPVNERPRVSAMLMKVDEGFFLCLLTSNGQRGLETPATLAKRQDLTVLSALSRLPLSTPLAMLRFLTARVNFI